MTEQTTSRNWGVYTGAFDLLSSPTPYIPLALNEFNIYKVGVCICSSKFFSKTCLPGVGLRVNDCCLAPTQQFVSYMMARKK
jgi:hypothetical protein